MEANGHSLLTESLKLQVGISLISEFFPVLCCVASACLTSSVKKDRPRVRVLIIHVCVCV